jgi:shikimate kinase
MMDNNSPFEKIAKVATIKSSGNIAFVGFMGTGKTTVGKILAQKCGLPFVDIDRVIVEKKGMEIPSIFNKYGESYFRDLEEDILKEVLLKDCQIISCGGGSIIRESNRKLLIQRAVNCWLYNAPELSLSRINSATRPLLNEANPLEKAKELFENRAPLYFEVADYKLCTENLSLNQISDIIYENIYRPIFG